MCIAIPKLVISVKKEGVLLASGGTEEKAGTLIKIKKGDWVLTQDRFVIRKIGRKEAEKINKILKI